MSGHIPPQSAKYMSTKQITDEIGALDTQLDEMPRSLGESGGMSGSPGEWMYERLSELETELTRRRDRPAA